MEAVLAGLEQHPLEAEPIGLLLLGAFGDPGPRRTEPFGQLIADPLELTESEQARLGRTGLWVREATHRPCGHERGGKLTLQPTDLLAQRPPRSSLVDLE